MGKWEFAFDAAKNDLLKRERGVSFEQVISLIEGGKLLAVLEHPDQTKYPGQLVYEVDLDGYVYVVPVVVPGSTLFLKTIYPSRKARRRKRAGGRQ